MPENTAQKEPGKKPAPSPKSRNRSGKEPLGFRSLHCTRFPITRFRCGMTRPCGKPPKASRRVASPCWHGHGRRAAMSGLLAAANTPGNWRG